MASRASGPGDPRIAGDFDLSWIGHRTGRAERRQVVALAIGFVPVAVVDPEDIVEAIARRRSFVQRIVSRHCGTVARVDPDVQNATWGWPTACEADLQLAVAAALEIAEASGSQARCGVDAGIAITPETDDNMSGIGIVGEMHATASALQLEAEDGCVRISETVRQLIGAAFEISPAPAADGKLQSWKVLPRRASPSARLPDIPYDLIGRSREITALSEQWAAASIGPGKVVCLKGESGVGKSALAARIDRLVRDCGGRVEIICCLHETQTSSLAPVRRLLAALGQPEPGARGLDTTQALAALRNAIDLATARLPLLLIVENLQWCDPDSLRVLEQLGECIAAHRSVMLLNTRRPIAEDGGQDAHSGMG